MIEKTYNFLKDLVLDPETTSTTFYERWQSKYWSILITAGIIAASGALVGFNFVMAHFVDAWLLLLPFVPICLIANALQVTVYLTYSWGAFKLINKEKRPKIKVLAWFYAIPQLIYQLVLTLVIMLLIFFRQHPLTVIAYDISKYILYIWIISSSVGYLQSIDKENILKPALILIGCFVINYIQLTVLNYMGAILVFGLFE